MKHIFSKDVWYQWDMFLVTNDWSNYQRGWHNVFFSISRGRRILYIQKHAPTWMYTAIRYPDGSRMMVFTYLTDATHDRLTREIKYTHPGTKDGVWTRHYSEQSARLLYYGLLWLAKTRQTKRKQLIEQLFVTFTTLPLSVIRYHVIT